jgi:murein DD-endopeptidase MepM/ murein hydrolase activator NlpD
MRVKKRFRIWSIIVMSDADKPIRKLRIPKFLFSASLTSIIAIITILSSAFVYFQHYNDQLINENQLLSQHLEAKESIIVTLRSEQTFLQEHAVKVEQQLSQLEELEIKIREISQSLSPDNAYYGSNDAPMGGKEVSDNEESKQTEVYEKDKDYSIFTSTQTASDKYESITSQLPKLIEKYEDTINSIEQLKAELQYTPTIWPTDVYRVTSTYGYRKDPITRRRSLHTGIDIAGPWGSPIYATADGKVSLAGWDGSYGYSVVINHSKEYQTRYGHLSRYTVRNGEVVKKGDVIGYMGTSGRSTGVHLHYEVLRNGASVNPDPYLTFIIQ